MSDYRREIVVILARSAARLYALAAALVSRRGWDAGERAAEFVRVLEVLQRTYVQLAPLLPDGAESVFEQYRVVRNVQANSLDDVQAAMALTRAGLIINTWCTAPNIRTQATDGSLTIGGLLQTLGTLPQDPRYQAAVAEQLAATAYDNLAARQLGASYFQAHEAYSVLELHGLLSMADTSHAADLLDNASRGALTAARFLGCEPLAAHDSNEADAYEAEASYGSDGAQADEAEAEHCIDGAQADDSGAQADEAEAEHCIDGAQADDSGGSHRETDRPDDSESATAAARDPPAFKKTSSTHWARAGPIRLHRAGFCPCANHHGPALRNAGRASW